MVSNLEVLADCQLARLGRLAILRERGKVRDNFRLIDALSTNPSPHSSPLLKGERRQKPAEASQIGN